MGNRVINRLAITEQKPNEKENERDEKGQALQPALDTPVLLPLVFADGVFVMRDFRQELEVHILAPIRAREVRSP